jgi:hypothetical protein
VTWVPYGGRAPFSPFSLDGTTQVLLPVSGRPALRSGRAGRSLRGKAD